MIYQDKFYYRKESNAYFKRWLNNNRNYNHKNLRKSKSEILHILEKNIDLNGKKILEIGCFVSDLLYILKSKYNCKVSGIESSSLACKYAKEKYSLNIENKTFLESSKFLLKKKNYMFFDLIICDDVLSWFGRETILPCLGSIDWMLKENGNLFLRDFSPSNNFAVKNHHWTKEKIYNFKIKGGHKSFFLKTGKYFEVQNYVRIDSSYQKIKSKNLESLIWSDSLLRKTSQFTFPIVKI
jgi:cyclopropane fatty-acyl-phospholipid synthase-like methyltransferase